MSLVIWMHHVSGEALYLPTKPTLIDNSLGAVSTMLIAIGLIALAIFFIIFGSAEKEVSVLYYDIEEDIEEDEEDGEEEYEDSEEESLEEQQSTSGPRNNVSGVDSDPGVERIPVTSKDITGKASGGKDAQEIAQNFYDLSDIL